MICIPVQERAGRKDEPFLQLKFEKYKTNLEQGFLLQVPVTMAWPMMVENDLPAII